MPETTGLPPIRKLTLFKHGVAYLERVGPCQGSIELPFRREQMGDVLKSLHPWIPHGNTAVLAVRFARPEDPEAVLQDRNLVFPPGQALSGLLSAMRGQRVLLATHDPEGLRLAGDLFGYESIPGPDGSEIRLVTLHTGAGCLALIDQSRIASIELASASAKEDLTRVLEQSRAATTGALHAVTVQLSGPTEELHVSYVIAAPTWRVSYRVALTGSDSATARVTGWGIIHNPTDEDITQADLVLTTGQPVSFSIDLFNPKQIERAVVTEESRAGVTPTRFESAMRRTPMAHSRHAATMAFHAPANGEHENEIGDADDSNRDSEPRFGSSAKHEAEQHPNGADRGEFFEYRVAGGVSLPRGGSAMVPLFSVEVPAKRQRIWREGSNRHPDIVITLENQTGAVLEEGPAILYEAEAYGGEAMVPFTARNATVRLGYAKDLAMRCSKSERAEAVFSGVRIGRGHAIEEFREELSHTFRVENDHEHAIEVYCELRRNHDRTLADTHALAADTTEHHYRFLLTVPAHGVHEIVALERWKRATTVQWDDVTELRLSRWLQARFLDESTISELSAVLALQEHLGALREKRSGWNSLRDEAFARMPQIADQLRVLKDSGPEGTLRLRYVEELGVIQDKAKQADDAIAALISQLAQVESAWRAALARAMGADAP
jgi:hypothetical protein